PPSSSRTITAIASGWMIRSWASRRASSAAASAVAWSGYPMAIRSAIVFPSSFHASPHDTSPDGCPPHPRRVKSAAVLLAGECYYARLGRVLERDEQYERGRSTQRRGSVHSSAYAATALDVPLESKLHAPEPRDGWVERPPPRGRVPPPPAHPPPRAAPAGYGKTTLIAQWRCSAAEDRPFAWV